MSAGITLNRRHDNHKEHLYRYHRLADGTISLETIIPFFRTHPLRSVEAARLREVRATASSSIDAGRHLTTARA